MYGGGYGGQQAQWQGYQLQTYPIQVAFIEQYGPGIFNYFDRDRSGFLDRGEVLPMVNQLFQYLQMPPPNPNDVLYIMAISEQPGQQDGRLSYPEMRRLLLRLGGHNHLLNS